EAIDAPGKSRAINHRFLPNAWDTPVQPYPIRQKRLAKLGASAARADGQDGGSSSEPSSSSSSTEERGQGRAAATVAARRPPPAGAGPGDAGSQGSSGPALSAANTAAKTSTSGAGSAFRTPSGSPAPEPGQHGSTASSGRGSALAASAQSSKASAKAIEPLEEWEDRTIRSVLRVSLHEDRLVDAMGNQLQYLPDLKAELQGDGLPLRLAVANVDQAIIEAASTHASPSDYAVPAWKRAAALVRNFRHAPTAQAKERYSALEELKRLCMSYCLFSFTMLDIFGLETPIIPALVHHLLLEPNDELGIDAEFIEESLSNADDDESIVPAYVDALEYLSRFNVATATESGRPDIVAAVRVLRTFVRTPRIANEMTQRDTFLPAEIEAPRIEFDSTLGPFFRLSPLNEQARYFPTPQAMSQDQVRAAQQSMCMLQTTHADALFDVINHLLRASRPSRNRVLDWFAAAINGNHKRRAMRVDPRAVSSHGFMMNLTTVLDLLCEPFMDAAFGKIDRIEADYFRRQPRINLDDETKLNADQSTTEEYYSHMVDGTSTFISEVFFLTVAAHHYGSAGAMHDVQKIQKELSYLKEDIARLKADVQAGRASSLMLTRYEYYYNRGLGTMYAYTGVLSDNTWQARAMLIMRYIIVWLMRLVSGKRYPQEAIELPLPTEKNMAFSCLPEYFVEDIVDSFKFIMRVMPQIMTVTQAEELVTICVTFLQCSDYVKNPYLKAGLVTILYHGSFGRYQGQEGVFVPLLNATPFCNQYLLNSLMKFYIEAEHTGTHTQFYDKFNIRYEIFQILKVIWPNHWYQDKLRNEANDNQEFFVQFVNLLLNDVTYVLDESLSAFVNINSISRELENAGESMDEETRKAKEKALHEAEGRAKSYMALTNDTVHMLTLFTQPLASSFTTPEIVQRLADMLDYNLAAMVGPRSSDLKVTNPQEYDFRPRDLLSDLVTVYLNLAGSDSFILAVARDGRSYRPENFAKAQMILEKWALKSQEELAAWVDFRQRVEDTKAQDAQVEEDLGEIPDEFLDPLMFTLMEDPVILPRSRISIDRATIRSHLLSDPNDPFNRMPLSMEDVIPDTELKAKIEAFKATRRGAAQGNRESGAENAQPEPSGDRMNLSED
ncbi:hypothetical protein KEM52_005382, partial [Ascosphaera acerosa]